MRYVMALILGLLLIPFAVFGHWIVPTWTFLWQRIEAFFQSVVDVCIAIFRPVVETFRTPLTAMVAGWHRKFVTTAAPEEPVHGNGDLSGKPEPENEPPSPVAPVPDLDLPQVVVHERAEKNGKPRPEFTFMF